MALIEALIEAPANRLRRLWGSRSCTAGQSRRAPASNASPVGLRRWASRAPEFCVSAGARHRAHAAPGQAVVRYGGLSTLIFAGERPLRGQARWA